ncbi:MAG: hypothetical protein M3337_05520 [Actinomycetota bacterium]|nr:hypothetical protein [Actinomycetota bacterium]
MTAAVLPDVHDAGAWVLIGLNAVGALWALAAHLHPALRGRPLWAVVIAAQLAAFVQAVSGVLLVTQEDRQLDDLHALYGFSALIAVGILYSYRTSPFMRHKEYLLYGFGCLFIMGLGLRELVL